MGAQDTENLTFEEKVKIIQERLLDWYDRHGRKYLPWRRDDVSPFQKLVAEILLQKTRAENILSVYSEFVRKYPDPQSLAKENEEKLAKLLKPLGLYRNRAKNLLKLAKALACKEIPRTREELEKLPGIGPYIANAFLVSAYGKCLPVVDTNVRRFVERVFSIKSKRDPRRDPKIWRFVERLLPSTRCREFIWALLDFSALICKAKNPECEKCPIRDVCDFYAKSSRPSS